MIIDIAKISQTMRFYHISLYGIWRYLYAFWSQFLAVEFKKQHISMKKATWYFNVRETSSNKHNLNLLLKYCFSLNALNLSLISISINIGIYHVRMYTIGNDIYWQLPWYCSRLHLIWHATGWKTSDQKWKYLQSIYGSRLFFV